MSDIQDETGREQLPESVASRLGPDETVVWSAKPERSLFVRRHRTISALGMLFLAIVAFWFALSLIFIPLGSPIIPTMLWYWGLPSLIVGLLLLYGPLLIAIREWRNTIYLLTNRRLIVQRGIAAPKASFIRVDQLPRIEVDANQGWGDVMLLGGSALQSLDVPGRQDYQPGPLKLRGLRDPEQVRDRLVAARSGFQSAGA